MVRGKEKATIPVAFFVLQFFNFTISKWPRSTMDSTRVSEAPDSGSIPDEATIISVLLQSLTVSNIQVLE